MMWVMFSWGLTAQKPATRNDLRQRWNVAESATLYSNLELAKWDGAAPTAMLDAAKHDGQIEGEWLKISEDNARRRIAEYEQWRAELERHGKAIDDAWAWRWYRPRTWWQSGFLALLGAGAAVWFGIEVLAPRRRRAQQRKLDEKTAAEQRRLQEQPRSYLDQP